MSQITAMFLALWLVLGATTHAQALPIGLAIAGFLGITGTAATIAGAVIALAIGVGAQLLVGALFRKRPADAVGGTTGKLQTGGVVPRSFPVGAKAVVTHSLVYWHSFGQEGKTPNAYVAFVFALADLPVGGGRAAVQEIWPNGTKATWNPDATPGTYGIPIPEFNKDGRDHMWAEVFDGTQTEADPFMVAQFGGDTERPYDSGRVGYGVVYVRIICRHNRDLFGGFPSFKFVCRGIPLYDAREDTTAGGSGSQRWNNPATWTPAADNPMVVSYNVLRGVTYVDEWFFGGQTVGARQLPFAAWNAAANGCDVEVDLNGGGTEPQFRCAGEIRLDMEPADVIEDLLKTCNGRLGEIGGVYKPHVGAAGVAVLSITDADIRTDSEQTFEPFFGLQDIVNSVNAKYVEPGEGWTAKDAPALIRTDLEAIDGGRRQPVDVQLDYVTSGTQVQRLMKAALSDYRRERRHALPLAPEAWRLEPCVDFISWTSERNGYTNKLFSVEAATDMDNFLVGVQLKEVDPSDYDWDETTDESPIIISPTPLVYPPAQAIDDWDAEPVRLTTASGLDKAAIRLLWDGNDIDDVIGVEFQVWDNGLTEIIYEGATAPSTVPLGEVVISANIVSATTYKVRGRFIPGSGRQVSWSGYIAVTTPEVLVNWTAFDVDIREGIGGAMMRQMQEMRTLVDQLSAQVQSLEQSVLGQGQAIRLRVTSVYGSATAQLLETYTVLATADAAITSTLNSLSAQVNDATTGLPATRSTLLSFQSTQATFNSAITTSLTTLSSQVNDPTTGLPQTRSEFTSFQSTQSTLNASFGSSITTLQSQYGSLSASGTLQFTTAASLPSGATSGVKMLVKAADSGNMAEAGLEAYAIAGLGGSPRGYVVLVGDAIYARDSSGGAPFKVLDVSGRMLTEGIMPGGLTASRRLEIPDTVGFTPAGGSTLAPGNATNAWYFQDIGTIDIVANAESLGTTGSIGMADFMISGRVVSGAAFSPAYTGGYVGCMALEFSVVARHATLPDVVLGGGALRPYNIVSAAFSTSITVSSGLVGIVDAAGWNQLAAGTWAFKLAWRLRDIGGGLNQNITAASLQFKFSGVATVRSFKR